MRRKVFSIRIDPKIWKKAQELDINASRVCEEALKREIGWLVEKDEAYPSDRTQS